MKLAVLALAVIRAYYRWRALRLPADQWTAHILSMTVYDSVEHRVVFAWTNPCCAS